MEKSEGLYEKYVRIEGAALLIYGVLSVLLSVFLIFIMRAGIENNEKTGKMILLLGFVVLFSAGMYSVIRGIFYMFHKLYFDYNNTAGIVKNERYELNDILQVMKNNSKLMEISEKGSISSLLESMYPPFLKMPNYIKKVAAIVLEKVIVTIGIVLVVMLGAVSSFILKDESAKFFSLSYLGWVSFAVLAFYWMRRKGWSEKSKQLNAKKISKVLMSAVIASVLFPLIVMFLKSNFKLNEIAQKPYLYLVLLCAVIIYFVSAVIYMIKVRSSSLEDVVFVSRKSGNIQENINPNNIFFSIQKLITDKIYYKKYVEAAPVLNMHGSQNKGNFESRALYEIMENRFSKDYKKSYMKIVILNAVIAFAGSLFLFYKIAASLKSGETNIISIFAIPMIIMFFTNLLAGIVHNFITEIYFESSVLFVETNGSYSENSKVFGSAVNDSLKESNAVVRSNMHFFFYSAKVITSSFGIAGERTILSINENGELMNEVEKTLYDTVKNNRNIGEMSEDEIKVFKERQDLNSIAAAMKRDHSAMDRVIEVKEEKKAVLENSSEIYCSACDTVHTIKSKFCPNCGFKMESAN